MKLTATHNTKEITAVKIAENVYTVRFMIYNDKENYTISTTSFPFFMIECCKDIDDYNYSLTNTIMFSVEGKEPFEYKVLHDKKGWVEVMFVFTGMDRFTTISEQVFAAQGVTFEEYCEKQKQ